MNFYYLTGGNTKDFKVCIKMALDEHVRMLQEESKIVEKVKNKDASALVRGDDPF